MKKNRPHPEKSGDASRPRIPVVELYHYNIINTNKKSKIKKNSQKPTISKTQTYNSGYALVFCLLSSVYPQYHSRRSLLQNNQNRRRSRY